MTPACPDGNSARAAQAFYNPGAVWENPLVLGRDVEMVRDVPHVQASQCESGRKPAWVSDQGWMG